MDRLYIREDITDWRERAMRNETIPSSEQELVELLDKGVSSYEVATAGIVSQEMGQTKERFFRPNKMLIASGAMLDLSRMIKTKKVLEVEGKEGKTYAAPGYVGRIGRMPDASEEEQGDQDEPEQDDGGPSYVNSQSEQGLNRAESYLVNVIPSHVWNRLLIVKANGGDVKESANMLIDNIQSMVQRLV